MNIGPDASEPARPRCRRGIPQHYGPRAFEHYVTEGSRLVLCRRIIVEVLFVRPNPLNARTCTREAFAADAMAAASMIRSAPGTWLASKTIGIRRKRHQMP